MQELVLVPSGKVWCRSQIWRMEGELESGDFLFTRSAGTVKVISSYVTGIDWRRCVTVYISS